MDDYIAVYLFDVKRAIDQLESFFVGYDMRYDVFEKDYLRQSAVERKAEIMGEAINRILKIQRDFPLPNAKAIIDTRNRIIHGYVRLSRNSSGAWLYVIYLNSKKM